MTFLARAYWRGSYNAEIKQRMLENALSFADPAVFWIGEANIRSRRAVEKISRVLRDGVNYRDVAGDHPYVFYEIKNL
jgi:hypothetical protein